MEAHALFQCALCSEFWPDRKPFLEDEAQQREQQEGEPGSGKGIEVTVL
jgi:hypothetical protein